MGDSGQLDVGQLARQAYGDQAVLIGFTTHAGDVAAASDWDEPVERKTVRDSLPGSFERLFHDLGVGDFALDLRTLRGSLPRERLLERAIGVIYRPETERQSHYFQARVADQFDAVVHIDDTRAMEPLERTAAWEKGEAPETYPFAV